MLLEEVSEFQKPAIFYEDKQGEIFNANNRQVGMRIKWIEIRHHFMRNVVEENDIDIKYISSKENPFRSHSSLSNLSFFFLKISREKSELPTS